ncbi:MAG: PleD family two-component system response regulator [Rhodobacteraceae bacterium]|nr:PleD family two-component system response regulator [Paracoccaceae bacterium]
MPGRILVVDDVATNRLILKAKLSTAYYDVLEADCGLKALEMAQRELPDIILLDVMMPDLDGFEVCKRLKSDPETSHIPVVMVTAMGSPQERIQGLNAGADDFLTKPINDLALFARVRNLMRVKMMFDELRMRDSTSREMGLNDFLESLDNSTDEPETVMLSPPNLEVGRDWKTSILETLDVQVIGTGSEREALNLSSLELPDAYVVNQEMMENGDGLRLVSALRSKPETRQAAILFVVSDGKVETAARGLDLGASDYIMAPFDPNELVVRLRSQLRRKKYSDRLRTNMRDGLKMAVIDPLTGLYNRRYATQHMTKIVDRALSSGGEFTVMMMDLDKFKLVNDNYGHDAGDFVLKEFTRRLQENVRGVDLVARMGGEEFLVVMPDAGRFVAEKAAERLRDSVERDLFHLPSGEELKVTVSVGVAIGSATNAQPDDLIKQADQALYKAKEKGRNLVSFFASAA